jgi:hypothetical protein
VVTNILEDAPEPLRVRDIHRTVEGLLGEPIPYSSVKNALSAHTGRGDRRFRRTRRGCYGLRLGVGHPERVRWAESRG